jgi:hypothetical protein
MRRSVGHGHPAIEPINLYNRNPSEEQELTPNTHNP